MKIFLIILAVAGAILLAVSVTYALRWPGLIGASALIVAAVVGALSARTPRRGR